MLVSRTFPHKTAALGLASDVRFAKDANSLKRDGIKIDLEHADGESLTVVVPYHRHGNAFEFEVQCSTNWIFSSMSAVIFHRAIATSLSASPTLGTQPAASRSCRRSMP